MIKEILSVVGGFLKIAAEWFLQYGSKRNQESRIEKDEDKKIDEFHEAIKERDLDAVRRKLSDNS